MGNLFTKQDSKAFKDLVNVLDENEQEDKIDNIDLAEYLYQDNKETCLQWKWKGNLKYFFFNPSTFYFLQQVSKEIKKLPPDRKVLHK